MKLSSFLFLALSSVVGGQRLQPSPSKVNLLRGHEGAPSSTSTIKEQQQHRQLPKGGNGGGGNTNHECKISGEKIGIYIGGGTGPSSKLWAQALAEFWKSGSRSPEDSTPLNEGRTAYVGDASATYVTFTTTEFEKCYNGELHVLDLLVMPGGSAYEIQDTLGSAGKAAITAYLNQGGNYAGFCAGGYYAARGYYWKGDDGAPVDNCDNQFCMYQIDGTFSYDTATQGFTRHEWGGTSYHQNLLGYGPLANVLVEGPIEEIASPWDPPKYDSVEVKSSDASVPPMRQIYYGGATENYIYTHGNNWGSELAHFISSDTDGDLPFPNNSMWSLKEAVTNEGTANEGKIIISSSHIEASLYYTGIGDGGMTECQQYNNYVFLTRALINAQVLSIAMPDYDGDCSANRGGTESIRTAQEYPGGLAYQNAKRIGGATTTTLATTTASTSAGSTVTGDTTTTSSTTSSAITTTAPPLLIDFEDGTLGPFTLSGGADNPWKVDAGAACEGTAYGVTAGLGGGVDRESYLTMTVPAGVSTVSYRYSHTSALDSGDDFHVLVNGVKQREYDTDDMTSCAPDSVSVLPGDTLVFKCKSGGNGESCSIDQVFFS